MTVKPDTSGRADPRNIEEGRRIPTRIYSDQPYVVIAADGAWVCVVTTGTGHEGEPGQTVAVLRSTDEGRTWSEPVLLEPADGPETSYAVALRCPSGRIYAFYNHNTDRVREIKREDEGVYKRVDSLGHYVFKFSDDHGRTWSPQRHEIPVRRFALDHANIYKGELRFFWNVGRPIISADGSVFLPHTKVGSMGKGFYAQSEGVFLHSTNLLTERDPTKITWETLPDGDIGLRPPSGSGRVAEEQTIVELSDGALYTVYRTVGGHPAASYSRDRGHTWDTPAYKRYSPESGARLFKHGRAANFIWKTSGGRFLYWFHNHGGPVKTHLGADWFAGEAYHGRNPAWLSAGHEVDTPQGKAIAWSEPEILLYDDEPITRISYPDLIESQGRFWVTETQKTIARVHAIEPRLIDALLNQHERETFAEDGVVLHAVTPRCPAFDFPRLPEFRRRHLERHVAAEDVIGSFTLDFTLETLPSAAAVVLDTLTTNGEGLRVTFDAARQLTLEMGDGRQKSKWTSDPLPAHGPASVTIIVDGGPRIIMFVVNGVLHDGGATRQFGWGRFSPTLLHANGSATAQACESLVNLRVYDRALLVSESVGNHRAARQTTSVALSP